MVAMSLAERISVKAFVWNEGEVPVELVWDGPDNFDRIQMELTDKLNDKEFGKIVKTYPATEHWKLDGVAVFYYRAFTCPHRGRQIVSGIDEKDMNSSFAKQQQHCSMRVFSPDDLYKMRPISVSHCSLHVLLIHVPEIDHYNLNMDKIGDATLFETRTLVSHNYDGRRTWELKTVWFEGIPVMVVNNSGRDNDEYHGRWITNPEQYYHMVQWLNTFAENPDVTGYVSLHTVIPSMTEFYGHTIHDYYDVDKQEMKK